LWLLHCPHKKLGPLIEARGKLLLESAENDALRDPESPANQPLHLTRAKTKNIMGLADELQKLDALRRQGALSDAEFAQAKATLLAGGVAAEQPLG
jgi:hypothetical protein